MFSPGHLFFILLSTALILAGVAFCRKKRPPIRKVLLVCLCLGVLSEVNKILELIKILPVVEPVVENGILLYRETGAYAPYLEAEHLPLELCSLQILFMLLALLLRNPTWRKRLYALMYSTCIAGASIGILLSSEAPGLNTFAEFLSSPQVWRAFLYHSMLIVLGIAIGMSEECDVRFRDLPWTILFIAVLDWLSFYLNSMMSTPYYSGDTLIGIGNVVNYFSSYNNPLGIPMATKGQWFLYLLIRIALALILITLVHLPLLKKERSR